MRWINRRWLAKKMRCARNRRVGGSRVEYPVSSVATRHAQRVRTGHRKDVVSVVTRDNRADKRDRGVIRMLIGPVKELKCPRQATAVDELNAMVQLKEVGRFYFASPPTPSHQLKMDIETVTLPKDLITRSLINSDGWRDDQKVV